MLRLDINLVFTIINLLVLCFLLTKFLFKPVNRIIAQREAAIKEEFDEARETKKESEELKNEYLQYMENAKQEAANIVKDAKSKAKIEYERILKLADEEAQRRLQKAEETIAEEKSKSIHSVEKELEDLVISAAAKVVGKQVSLEDNQKLYDEFIKETGGTL